MNSDIKKNSITEGSITKGLLFYFFPIFVGSLFQQLYNTVDSVIVGRFVGTEALAAVGGSAGQIYGILLWFLGGIAGGATVTVAQHYGAEDAEGVHKDIHNGFALAVIGSLFLAIFGFIFCRPIFVLMKTPVELLSQSVAYIRVLFSGLVISFLFNMGSGILRALGDSKRPLWYLIICCLINIILDLFFVVIVKTGVIGAAIATIIAQAISAFLVILRIMKLDPRYALRIRKIRIYPEVMKTQLRIGLPGGFQSALYGIANIIIQTAINALGTTAIAANTAFGKLDSVFWLVNGAFGTAVTNYVGQNFGAGKLDRVKKSTLVTLLTDGLLSLVISAVLVIFGRPLLGIFTKDEDVIRVGMEILATVAPFYIAYVSVEVLSGSLRGMGNVFIPTILTLSGICALRIAWVFFIVPLNPVLQNITIVFAISWLATSILFIIYYLYAWKKIKRQAEKAAF